ncbi:hypothetical protein [Bradyrhizobium sp. CCGE-LA001]|uniref:hypothetical protein n=1 Tax=Bradyrhizobium sp. CCGE-LA001 TaxID=1223566 RepID=UPI001198291D|nr:hypothetical protein [Bradyrhizobium sp. CCGE-LA001]
MQDDTSNAVAILSSGQSLKIYGVTLYPTEAIAVISGLRSEAASKMGGVSTGIGFIGSPTWAIGAGAALGFLESVASDAARKNGLKMFAEADRQTDALLAQGLLFRMKDVTNSDRPLPASWSSTALVDDLQTIAPLSLKQQADVLSQNGLTRAELVDGHLMPIKRQRLYSHNGDEFLAVDTEFGLINIRWSSVVGYIGPNRNSPPPLPR